MTRPRSAIMPLVLFAFIACGAPESESEPAAADQPASGEMEGMSGMDMQGGMMEEMMGHMQVMTSASPDSMQGMVAMHRQRAGNMLARMNREMREMNMEGDDAWTATVDSVRQDLVSMPQMNPSELQELMPEHHRRITRLIETHRSMMGTMQM